MTIRPPAAEARAVMPAPMILNLHPIHATNDTSLTLMAGDQAVLDSMAEVFPYEFPPN